jgi:hypothetical protein
VTEYKHEHTQHAHMIYAHTYVHCVSALSCTDSRRIACKATPRVGVGQAPGHRSVAKRAVVSTFLRSHTPTVDHIGPRACQWPCPVQGPTCYALPVQITANLMMGGPSVKWVDAGACASRAARQGRKQECADGCVPYKSIICILCKPTLLRRAAKAAIQ